MTRRSLPRKLATLAALVLATAVLVELAGARGVFSGDERATSSARKHRLYGFKVGGNLRRPLAPGVSQPLNLRLTNPYRFSLKVKRLTIRVRVAARAARRGCRVSRDFKVRRLPKRAYPIRLRPRRTRTLRALRVRPLPAVTMRNLPINQDACKRAKLVFKYGGRARRWYGGPGR